MAEVGPTQGAARHQDEVNKWKSRPWLARLVRVFIFVAPLVASLIFTWQLGRAFPPQELGINRWVWIAGVFVLANGLLIVLSRLWESRSIDPAFPTPQLLELPRRHIC